MEGNTHDDIHSLVQVDYDAFLVDNWNSTDTQSAEDVNDIKDSGVQCGSSYWVERIAFNWGDVCSNTKRS